MSEAQRLELGWIGILVGLCVACGAKSHNLGEEPSVSHTQPSFGGSGGVRPTQSTTAGDVGTLVSAERGQLAGAGGLAVGGPGLGLEELPEPVNSSEFAALFAKTVCAAAANCCLAHSFDVDEAGCRNYLQAQWGDFITRHTANAAYVLKPYVAARCIVAARNAALACTDRALIETAQAICDDILEGAARLGERCSETAECVQQPGPVLCGSSCASDPYDCERRCIAPSQLGEACEHTCRRDRDGVLMCLVGTGTNGFCWLHDGLVCGASGRCVTAPRIGEACSVDLICAEGVQCAMQTCVASSNVGTCFHHADCPASSYCADEHHCVPYASNLADGQVCVDDRECAAGNCSDGKCGFSSDYDGKRCGAARDCVTGDCQINGGNCRVNRMAGYVLCSGN